MNNPKQVPVIYNLFPRIAETIWLHHASHAAEMGFNWLYINSIHYQEFSGSLYAAKQHYRIKPQSLPHDAEKDGLTLTKQC